MTGARPHPPVFSERLLVAFAAALLLLSAAAQWLVPPPAEETGTPALLLERNPELEWQGRYLLGLDQLLRLAGQDRAQLQASLETIISSTPGPVDRLRLAALAVALEEPDQAAELVNSVRGELDETTISPFDALLAHPGVESVDKETVGTAEEALGAESVQTEPEDTATPSPEELEAAHGFYGELVVAATAGDLQAPRQASLRFALLVFAGAVAGVLALLIGSILSTVAYLRWRDGRLQSAYRREVAAPIDQDPALRTAYLETFILAILAMQVLGVIVALAMPADEGTPRWPLLLNWLLLPVMLWPLTRGLDRRAVLAGLGWTRGRGLIVEMCCGFIGYIAAAPLLVLGFLASALVARSLDRPPHHPILDWVQGAGALDLALIVSIAALWAPIVEESLFRGAFFHYLRARWGPLSSAFTVSVAFAALHPQGLAGLPFLISLAVALAMIREWRGSLIAPITVHLIHNSLVMGLLLSLL